MDNKDIITLLAIGILPWSFVMISYAVNGHRSAKCLKILCEKYSFSPGESGNKFNLVKGLYRNKPVQIEYFEPEEKKKVYTKLIVACENPEGFEFAISKRKKSPNPYYQNGSYLLDDQEFDDMFFISTNDLGKLKGLLDFNSRFKLQQAGSLGFKGEIKLEGDAFTYLEPGLMKNEHEVMKLELVLHELCDLADGLKNNEQLAISN